MTHSASTLVHDDISEHTFVTTVAIGADTPLVGVLNIIVPNYATAADVPSLDPFYI